MVMCRYLRCLCLLLRNLRYGNIKLISLYQNRRRLVAIRTHWGFIVLPYCETWLLERWFDNPTQSHYPDTELTRPYPFLTMLSARPKSDNMQFCKSLIRPRPSIRMGNVCSNGSASMISLQWNLSKSTDHGNDFEWSILGTSRIRELQYHYNGGA